MGSHRKPDPDGGSWTLGVPGHRRMMLLAAIIAVAALVILVSRLWGHDDASAGTTPTAGSSAGPTATVTASPAPVDPEVAARRVKPLVALVQGDRVLYAPDARTPRRVCSWVEWGGVLDVSVIRCEGETRFPVQTALLTPMEPRDK